MRRLITVGAFGSGFVHEGISRQPRDYTTGDFVTGLCNPTRGCSPPDPLSVSIEGGLHAITFSTGPLMELSSCPGGRVGRCYDFVGGSVSVLTGLGGDVIFSDGLVGGRINQDGNSFTILADLSSDASTVVRGGVAAAYTLGPVDQGVQRLSDGAATINFVSTVPEPGTLIGLAAMARRIVFSLYYLYVKIMVADYD